MFIFLGKCVLKYLANKGLDKIINEIKDTLKKRKIEKTLEDIDKLGFYFKIDSQYKNKIENILACGLKEELFSIALETYDYTYDNVIKKIHDKIDEYQINETDKKEITPYCYEIYKYISKELNKIDGNNIILYNNIISEVREYIESGNEKILDALKKHTIGNIKHNVNIISKKNIKYDIKLQLNNEDELKMYSREVSTCYSYEIKEIISMFNKTWKIKLLELLSNEPDDKYSDYLHMLEKIKMQRSYDAIYNDACDLVSKNYWKDKGIRENINSVLKKSKYNKAYIVTGEMGSGKTYFIANFIKQCAEDDTINIIPLHIHYKKIINSNTFEEALVRVFSEIIMHVESIEDIHTFLTKTGFKICVLIDSIQKVYFLNRDKFLEILDCVIMYTKYDNINWIFTVSIYEYFVFESKKKFIEHYCFNVPKNKYTKQNGIAKNSLDLNEYNNINSIPGSILYSYNVSVVINSDIKNIIFEKINMSPLYAHIIGKNFRKDKELLYCETHYEYLNIIVEFFIENISRNHGDYISNDYMLNLLDIINKSNELKHDEEKFDKIPQDVLNTLAINQLISSEKIKREKKIHLTRSILEYTFRVYEFWANMIIYFDSQREMKGSEAICKGKKFPKEFQTVYFSIYIMHIAQYKNKDILSSILLEFYNENLFYYPLFGVRKSGLEFERSIFNFLEKPLDNDIRLIYSFLFFLYYSKLHICGKIKFILINSRNIVECKLLTTYRNVLDKILSNFETQAHFENETIKFNECEEREMNVVNGYACAHKYTQILFKKYFKKTKYNPLKTILYIDEIRKYILENVNILNKQKSENLINGTFMDFFVRGILEHILIAHKTPKKIFNYIEQEIFFEGDEIISSFFKRNLICASGNVYSNNLCGYFDSIDFKKEYENIIDVKTHSDLEEDKVDAMFLILNSMNSHDLTLKIHLLSYFEKLWENDNIMEKVKNLEEVDKILKQINEQN